MIQQILKLFGIEFFVAQKVEKNARIEISRARPHGNPTSGSQPHRRVDGHTISHCTEARSIPQVRKNCLPGKLRAEVVDQRFVGNAMEPIALNSRVEVAARKRK